MFVLKSKYDALEATHEEVLAEKRQIGAALKEVLNERDAERIERLSWKNRAIKAEGIIEQRRAQAIAAGEKGRAAQRAKAA